MKRSLFLITFAFLLGLASFAQQADDNWFWGKPIVSIQWIGVQHADRKELDATVRPFIGKIFTDDVWNNLQAQVYALDWFDSIEPAAFPADPEKTKVQIRFTVKEKPAVAAVRVTGNSGLRTTEIMDVVTEKIGSIYDSSKTQVDELAVKKLYLDKGYPDAQVNSTAVAGGSGMVVTFQITEGSQVAIKEIHFSGATVFSEKVLRGQLDLKAAGFLQSGSFQESKLETDKQKIVDYYRARGFVDASVNDVVRTVSKDPKTGKSYLILTFVVAEGKKWLYGGVSFKGNNIFSTDKLNTYFTQQPGAVLNYTSLMQDKSRLDDLYYENGYIFNTLDLTPTRDADKMTISYLVTIVERDRAHIESISFKGNKKTKDYVLARELPLEVGDIFSKAKILEGLRNLYNLQYFSSVEPQMLPGSDENLMDLVLTVEEQSTADIQFGLTLSGIGTATTSNSFPISGLIKWNEKNLMGTGRTVGVALDASPTDQDVTLSYQDNWLFNKRISGGLSLTFAHKELMTTQDLLAPVFTTDPGVPDPYTSADEYNNATTSMSTAYEMPYEYWSATFGASSGYSMHTRGGDLGFGGGFTSTLYNDMYDTTKYRPADPSIRDTANSWEWTNKIPLSISLNSLDLWYNPSKGCYLSQKLTWAGLIMSLESQQYIRSDSRIDAFATLFNLPIFPAWNFKWVLGLHSAYSAILPQPFTSEAIVSANDDLRIDGTFVGRGWKSLYDIDGGRTLWDNWLELRMPILEQYFWIDGFLDVDALQTTSGLVQITSTGAGPDPTKMSFSQLGWDNLVMSMGFGIRFTIPQFPFRFYFAKQFSYDGSSINWAPASSTGGLQFVISMSQPLS
jgi:outer membrane protein insertion porin family